MNKGKKIVLMGFFVALGLVLQYIESFIPIAVLPGGKIGLSNIVTIVNIYLLGPWNAIIIATLRAFLGALLFGGVSAIPYSVVGAILSSSLMGYMIVKTDKFSPVGISVIGAVIHNFGQIIVAMAIFMSFRIIVYFPVLIVLGVLGGFITGICSLKILKHIKKVSFFGKDNFGV